MVQYCNGGSVSVLVDGQVAQEYAVEEKTEGLVKTHTCYIEAKEGSEFKIVTTGISNGDRRTINVKVDGTEADRSSACRGNNDAWTMMSHGYKTGLTSGQSSYRAFSFGAMEITSEGCPKKMHTAELDDVCTIRVEIASQTRNGPIDHRLAAQMSYELPSSTIQHEDSKPALWGISTRPGRELSNSGPVVMCHCKHTNDPNALRHVIVFKYLSHDWLVAKGLKEGSLNDTADDFAHDTKKAERKAPRRRVRQDREPWIRNSRIKREGTASSDVKTIKEEKVKKESVMVDLTGGGDHIPAQRGRRKVIVIEDDSDSNDF